MNLLVVFTALTWAFTFAIVVYFSRDRYKFGSIESVPQEIAVKRWALGARTGYYRLAIAFSGLITMGIVAAFKTLI